MIFADLELKINTKNGNEILLLKREPSDSDYQKTVLVTGVFHGDEPDGQYLIERYLSEKADTKNRLLFIPCFNPDGLALQSRTNANGVDLNRNYPSKNWENNGKVDDNSNQNIYFAGESPASENETKMMIYILEKYKPDLIISLHEPYSVVNYDGPAQEIARKISEITGFKIKESIGYPTPGSFGTYCGIEKNIPTITLELPEKSDKESLWNKTKGIFSYIAQDFC